MKRYIASLVLAAGLMAIPALAADRADTIRQTQQILKDKGHYQGEVDGIIGPKTRAALRSYQREQDLKVTGRLTQETAERLGAVKKNDPEVATHFENAGEEIVDNYSAAGRAVAKGSKAMASDVKEGEITAGAVDLGKGIGKGAKKVASGTKDAAVSAAKGVADAFDGENEDEKSKARKK